MTEVTRAPLIGVWLGTRPYAEVYELQCRLMEARKADRIRDTLLLLEHEPTITQGRGAKPDHLLSSLAHLQKQGLALVETDRGGDVTLHAPGQLVAYPIVKLHAARRDVRKYVNGLTHVMQALVKPHQISAGTAEGLVGLWTDKASPNNWSGHAAAHEPVKLGAIGVRISRWVTMHGFALNLSTDLTLFQHIVPCGISDYGVASIHSLTGNSPGTFETAAAALPLFGQELHLEAAPLRTWTGSANSRELEQMLTGL